MANEKLLVRIALPSRYHDIDTEDVEKLVLEHQSEFEPLFRLSIDVDDARVQYVDNSLEIEQVQIDDDGMSGAVDVEFMSEFYAGCKDLNSTDWHQETLPFSIEGGVIIFDIDLPIRWRVDN